MWRTLTLFLASNRVWISSPRQHSASLRLKHSKANILYPEGLGLLLLHCLTVLAEQTVLTTVDPNDSNL